MRSRGYAVVAAFALLGVLANPAAAAGSRAVTGTVRAAAVGITLSLSATTARVGDQVTATATVRNFTSGTLKTVTIDLRFDASGLALKPTGSQSVQVKAGRTADAKWSICGTRVGSYVIVARATVNGVSIDSDARLLTITLGAKKAACP